MSNEKEMHHSVPFFYVHHKSEMISNISEQQISPEWINHDWNCSLTRDGARVEVRSFTCRNCGVEHIEVPCPQGIMQCRECHNRKRNYDHDTDYAMPEPVVYFGESTDDYNVDDGVFDGKLDRKTAHNFLNNAEKLKLGTYDPDPATVRSGLEWELVQRPIAVKIGNRSIDQISVEEEVPVQSIADDLGLTSEVKVEQKYNVPIGLFEQPTEITHVNSYAPVESRKSDKPYSPQTKNDMMLEDIDGMGWIDLSQYDRMCGSCESYNGQCADCRQAQNTLQYMKNTVLRNCRIVKVLSDDTDYNTNDGKLDFKDVQINVWKKLISKGTIRIKDNASGVDFEMEMPFDKFDYKFSEVPTVSAKEFGDWCWKARVLGLSGNITDEAKYDLLDKLVPKLGVFQEYKISGFHEIIFSDQEAQYESYRTREGAVKKVRVPTAQIRALEKDWLKMRTQMNHRSFSYLFRDAITALYGSRKIAMTEEAHYDKRTSWFVEILEHEGDIPWKESQFDTKAIYNKKQACSGCGKRFVQLKRHKCRA